MRKVDEQINISHEAISKLIDTFGADERGFLSQNILDKLRTFVEAVSVKAAGETEYSYEIFESKARNYVASKADLRFLSKFHKSLQHSKSHYATDEEASERLMLKYYEYLLKIRSFLKKTYKLDVLENINEFPIKIEILDKDETIRPGMSVIIDIVTGKKEKVLTLRHEYIHQEKDQQFVILTSGNRQNIKTGLQNEETIEIIEGLKEGDAIRKVDFTQLGTTE